MQQTQQQFHSFLTDNLTPMQQRLLLDYLYQALHNHTPPDPEEMHDTLRGKPHSSENAELVARMVQALYYYSTYIYTPLVEHADKQNHGGVGQEGLILPHVIAMTQYMQRLFPNSQPFNSLILSTPIAWTLFARHYWATVPETTAALSSSSYAVTLTLAAQATAGIFHKHTTFNSFSAAMLASAYRHLVRKNYTMFAIDGILTVMNLEHQRGLVYTAMGAALMNTMQIPKENWPGVQFAQANYLLPLILAFNLTEDRISFLITATGMIFNQYLLYRPREIFLDTGQGLPGVEPYWNGALGIALMGALTLAVHWRDMPEASQVGKVVSNMTTELSRWLNYLVYLEETEDHESMGEHRNLTEWLTEQYIYWTGAEAHTPYSPIEDG